MSRNYWQCSECGSLHVKQLDSSVLPFLQLGLDVVGGLTCTSCGTRHEVADVHSDRLEPRQTDEEIAALLQDPEGAIYDATTRRWSRRESKLGFWTKFVDDYGMSFFSRFVGRFHRHTRNKLDAVSGSSGTDEVCAYCGSRGCFGRYNEDGAVCDSCFRKIALGVILESPRGAKRSRLTISMPDGTRAEMDGWEYEKYPGLFFHQDATRWVISHSREREWMVGGLASLDKALQLAELWKAEGIDYSSPDWASDQDMQLRALDVIRSFLGDEHA